MGSNFLEVGTKIIIFTQAEVGSKTNLYHIQRWAPKLCKSENVKLVIDL